MIAETAQNRSEFIFAAQVEESFYLKCRGEDPKRLARRDETPANIKQRSTIKNKRPVSRQNLE